MLMLVLLIAPSSFESGMALFRDLDYEHALVEFESAATQPSAPDERARALLWAGICRGSLGDIDEARALFLQARSALPTIAYPTDAPSKLRTLFDAAIPQSTLPPAAAPTTGEPSPAPAAAPAPVAGTSPPPEPTLPIAPLALAAASAAMLTGAGALAWVASATEQRSLDHSRYVGEAQADASAANVEYATAAVLVGASALGVLGAIAWYVIE